MEPIHWDQSMKMLYIIHTGIEYFLNFHHEFFLTT